MSPVWTAGRAKCGARPGPPSRQGSDSHPDQPAVLSMTRVGSPDLELGAGFQVKHYLVFGGQSPRLGGGYLGCGLALHHLTIEPETGPFCLI